MNSVIISSRLASACVSCTRPSPITSRASPMSMQREHSLLLQCMCGINHVRITVSLYAHRPRLSVTPAGPPVPRLLRPVRVFTLSLLSSTDPQNSPRPSVHEQQLTSLLRTVRKEVRNTHRCAHERRARACARAALAT